MNLISENFIKLLQQHPNNFVTCAFSVYWEFFFEVCLNKEQIYFAPCWDAFFGLTSNVHKVYKIYMLLRELNETLPYAVELLIPYLGSFYVWFFPVFKFCILLVLKTVFCFYTAFKVILILWSLGHYE